MNGRIILLGLLLGACAPAAPPSLTGPLPTVVGPPRGTLVVAGGGDLTGTGIIERFVQLAGGPDALIVIIPTADSDTLYSDDRRRLLGISPELQRSLWLFQDAGARNVRILHTYDPSVADSDEFVEPLQNARAVWFPGGRQPRLVDAYLDTRTVNEIRGVLDRGGVVGGSSAGASILASYLVRGDPEGNHIVRSPEGYERGFGFLRNAAIDQHLLVRGRQRDLLEVLRVYPQLLGIGIDESTAIVVEGDAFQVIGMSRVAVYDRSPRSAVSGYFLLEPGDVYDMRVSLAEGDEE